MSRSVRVRVGAVAIAALTVAAAACTDAGNSSDNKAEPPPTATQPAPTTRPSCEAAVPAAWQQAIQGSRVDTGGVSNMPVAVGRAGEVVERRDNGDTRDLLLIGADRSVAEIYAVPEPNRNMVGFVAMDARWIVVGVDRAPRGANGVLPTLTRIDVIDRQGGPLRTIVQTPEEDHTSGGATIDSVALFGDKVYWITRDSYPADTGKIQSYDLNTSLVEDVASGVMRNVRTTPAGLAWEVAWGEDGPRAELKIPDELPPPVAGTLGTGRNQMTLATDGSAYAWITGTERDGDGVAWWAPGSELVRVTGDFVGNIKHAPAVYVVGPYVVIDRGRRDQKYDTSATVVDTRSGAVAYLRESVAGADGGTIAVGLGGTLKTPPTSAGVLRADALAPLSC